MDWLDEVSTVVDPKELAQDSGSLDWLDQESQVVDANEWETLKGQSPQLKQAQAAIDQERRVTNAREFVVDPARRIGMGQVIPAALTMGGRVASMAARALPSMGLDEFADGVSRQASALEQAAEEATAAETDYPIVGRTMRGVISNLPPAILSGSIAGPYGALGQAALSEGSSALTEAKDAGLSDLEAAQYAQRAAAIEGGVGAIFQRVGLGGVEKILGAEPAKEATKIGLRAAIKQAGITAVQELPEELLTEIGHAVNNQLSAVDPEALSVDSLSKIVADTTAQTIATVGLVETPSIGRGLANDIRRGRRLEQLLAQRRQSGAAQGEAGQEAAGEGASRYVVQENNPEVGGSPNSSDSLSPGTQPPAPDAQPQAEPPISTITTSAGTVLSAPTPEVDFSARQPDQPAPPTAEDVLTALAGSSPEPQAQPAPVAPPTDPNGVQPGMVAELDDSGSVAVLRSLNPDGTATIVFEGGETETVDAGRLTFPPDLQEVYTPEEKATLGQLDQLPQLPAPEVTTPAAQPVTPDVTRPVSPTPGTAENRPETGPTPVTPPVTPPPAEKPPLAPGSQAKLDEMRRRVEAGEPVFQEGDEGVQPDAVEPPPAKLPKGAEEAPPLGGLVKKAGEKKIGQKAEQPAPATVKPVSSMDPETMAALEDQVRSGKMSREELDSFAAPDFYPSAKTGSPITLTAYHGSGRADKSSAYAEGAEGPALGEGKYWAASAKVAKQFGPSVEEGTVSLKSPFVLTNAEQLERIAGGPIPRDNASRNKYLAKARKAIQDAGHDGVIVNLGGGDIDENGKRNKLIREIFGSTQVVEFAPAKAKPAAQQPTGPKFIGYNKKNQKLYEDENGVRSYEDSGILVTEPVSLIPTRAGIKTGVGPRRPEYELDDPVTVDVIESPDLQLERRREEAKQGRLDWIKDRGIAVGDTVHSPVGAKGGVVEGISPDGFMSIRFEDGSSISGAEPKRYVVKQKGQAAPAATGAKEAPAKSLYNYLGTAGKQSTYDDIFKWSQDTGIRLPVAEKVEISSEAYAQGFVPATAFNIELDGETYRATWQPARDTADARSDGTWTITKGKKLGQKATTPATPVSPRGQTALPGMEEDAKAIEEREAWENKVAPIVSEFRFITENDEQAATKFKGMLKNLPEIVRDTFADNSDASNSDLQTSLANNLGLEEPEGVESLIGKQIEPILREYAAGLKEYASFKVGEPVRAGAGRYGKITGFTTDGNVIQAKVSGFDIPFDIYEIEPDQFAEGDSDESQTSDSLSPQPEPEAPAAEDPADMTEDEIEAAIQRRMLEKSGLASPPKKRLGQKKSPAKRPAAEKPAGEQPAKKKLGEKKPKPTLRDRADQASKEANDAINDVLKRVRELGLGMNQALDPQLIALTAKAAAKVVKAGLLKGAVAFTDFVQAMRKQAGDSVTRKLRPYLELGWESAYEIFPKVGPVTDFDQAMEVSNGQRDRESEETGEPVEGGTVSDANTQDQAGDRVLEGEPAGDVQEAREGGDAGGLGAGEGGVLVPDAGTGDQLGASPGRREQGSGLGTPDVAGERGQHNRPNYHLTDPEKIVGGTQKEKFERNRKAIEIAQTLTALNREPTPEELDTMAAYTGWGAFGQELFNGSWDKPVVRKGWEDENEWLRETLGKDAWLSAQDSIINAHYTDPETVQAMWDMARRMGFDGGRVLEPSMGVGNFFAMMPRDLMGRSQLTGIELDQITAEMAKHLYPEANIHQKGYETSQTPDNFYDLVISNVPFANFKPADRRYEKFGASIHNYFFLKAIDQVKPGGLVMFLTSNMTMDGKQGAARVRQYVESKADLVGAYRFPSGAFQRYAGTKVVADLIILRKRKEGEASNSPEWNQIVEVDTPSGEKIPVNEYWASNPKNVLGKLNWGHGTTSGRPGMIVEQTGDLQKRVDAAVQSVPEAIYNTAPNSKMAAMSNDTKSRQNTIVIRDGAPYIVQGEHLRPLEEVTSWKQARWKKETVERLVAEIGSLINVREALADVLLKQRRGDDATAERKVLNRTYDAFVSNFGEIPESKAVKILIDAGDPLGNAVRGLATKNADGSYSKRPIFSRTTTRTKKNLNELTIGDAYAVQRNEALHLNIDRIAELAKATPEEVVAELVNKGAIFKTGSGDYESADMFLAGNNRRKKREIEAAIAEGMEGLEKSLEKLNKVMPQDIPYTEISVKLGATWIEAADYQNFVGYLLNEPGEQYEVRRTASRWKLAPGDYFNKQEAANWAHPGAAPGRSTGIGPAFRRTFETAMNNGQIKVMTTDENDNPKVDEQATREANEKADLIREEFKNWLWTDPERIARLSLAYNETVNAYMKEPEFDGSHLSFDGLALQLGDDPFSFRKHQADAVWRGIVTGRGLYAHEVGTGKTFTMAGLAIESKRLGLANKPLLFAHNANSASVYRDIQLAYPGAKALYIDNLGKNDRDRAIAQIALDDWDVVVLPHSLIDRLEMRAETLEMLLRDEMDALESAARSAFEEDDSGWAGEFPEDLDTMDDEDLRNLRNPTAKELVKERMRLRARITRAAHAANNANTVFFEDMGIDMIMVDEAHVFKKLPISTRQRVKGLNVSGSERGTSMMLIADYIRHINNGRGVHLFTGTPITNALNEIYNMQRLIMAEQMQRDGFRDWDGWFNNFADSVSDIELDTGGDWNAVDRLSAFVNIPELRSVIGQYLDVVFADDMPEFVARSQRDGIDESPEGPVGRPYKVILNDIAGMTEDQQRIAQVLRERYRTFKNMTGKQKKAARRTEYNPVVIETGGSMAALDPRLFDISIVPAGTGLKVHRMIRNAMVYYNEHPKATQMIFMDRGHSDWSERNRTNEDGTKTKTRVPVFNLAKEIKRLLIAEGVPESEIVIFSGLDKDKRADAAEKMQRGEIRFAIGSTETMGTGVNAQNYMRAMHHLDAPWMPGELTQRNGRGHRQGNRWNTVYEHRYLTEGSHDGRRWQVLLTKDRFINAFIKNEDIGRILEGDATDVSEEQGAGDMEETFSAAAGDPRILIRAKLQKDVEKIQREKNRHARTVQEAMWRIRETERDLPRNKAMLERVKQDIATYAADKEARATSDKKFSLVLQGKEYNDWDEARAAMDREADMHSDPKEDGTVIGSYAGFDLLVRSKYLKVRGKAEYDANWSPQSVDAILRNLSSRVPKLEKAIGDADTFITSARSLASRPFTREADLQRKLAKLKAIEQELEDNPTPSPSWLRNGAPTGTTVYWTGGPKARSGVPEDDSLDMLSELHRERMGGGGGPKESRQYPVVGHRGDDTILLDINDKITPVGIYEVTDKYGTPVFSRPESSPEGGDAGGVRQPEAMMAPKRIGQKAEQAGSLKQTLSQTIGKKQGPESIGIAAQDIAKTWERLFSVPMRVGGFRIKGAMAIYKPSPEIIRIREQHLGELSYRAHEIAHHIDKQTDWRKNVPQHLQQEFQALDYDPTKARLFEGLAEFLRMFITERDMAQTLAPNATKWFVETWMVDHPEWGSPIIQAQKHARQYADQGIFARERTKIADRGPQDLEYYERWKRNVADRGYELFVNYVDRFGPLELVQEANLEAGGSKGKPGVYETAMAYDMTASSHAAAALELGPHLLTNEKVVGPSLWSLREKLKPGEYDEAILYAYARHTLFVKKVSPDFETGMSEDAAIELMASVSPDQQTRFDELADGIAKYGNALLRVAVDAGVMTAKDYNRTVAFYGNNYFPLRRVRDDMTSANVPPGTKLINLPRYLKARSKHGSGRPIYDPFDTMVGKTLETYARAAKARVMQRLVESTVPQFGAPDGMGGFVDKIDPKTLVHRGTIDEILKTLVSEGVVEPDAAKAMRLAARVNYGMRHTLSEADEDFLTARHGTPIDRVNDSPADIDQKVFAAAAAEPDVMAEINLFRPDFTPSASRATFVYVDRRGDKHLMEADRVLYRAISGMDDVQHPAFLTVFRGAASLLRTLGVNLSTGFGLKNLIRDYAEFQGRTDIKGFSSLSKPLQMLARYIAYKLRVFMGQPGGDAVIESFERDGGKMFSRLGLDIDSRTRERKRKLGRGQTDSAFSLGDLKDRFMQGIDGLQELIAVSDAPPRLAAMEAKANELGYESRADGWYKTSSGRKVNLPEHVKIRILNAAAEATTNFKRSGSLGRVINAYSAFLNATIQANYREFKLVKSTAKTLTGRGTEQDNAAGKRYLVYLSAMASLGVLYWALRGDDEDWREQEDWEHDQFWSWGANGRTYLWLPKPRDAGGMAANFVETLLSSLTDKDRKGVLSELSGVAIRHGSDRVPDPVPGGVVKSMAEVAMNYDTFRGKQLVHDYMKARPDELQFTPWTTETAKAIGSVTGKYGISPIEVEHVLANSTGGAYRRWVNLAESAVSDASRISESIQEGKPLEGEMALGAEHLPLIGAIYKNRHQSASVDDFYAERDATKRAVDLARARGEYDAEQEGKYSRLEDYDEMMAAIRKVAPKDIKGRRKDQFQPFIVGLAREALNRDPMENNPSPFGDDVELPSEVRDVLVDFAVRKAKRAILSEGYPEKTAQGDANYAETYGKWEAARKEHERWVKDHRDSPIVEQAIRDVRASDSYRNLLTRRGRPDFTPGGSEQWEDYLARLKRWNEKVARANSWLDNGQD